MHPTPSTHFAQVESQYSVWLCLFLQGADCVFDTTAVETQDSGLQMLHRTSKYKALCPIFEFRFICFYGRTGQVWHSKKKRCQGCMHEHKRRILECAYVSSSKYGTARELYCSMYVVYRIKIPWWFREYEDDALTDDALKYIAKPSRWQQTTWEGG